MKLGVLIPTRGDRDKFLNHAKKLLSNQSIQPDETLIVDFNPTDDKVDITKRYRLGCESLFIDKKCDLVVFWEDDDWYAPNYLEKVFNTWKINKPDVIGFGKTIYYHLFTKKYLIVNHPDRASACCTAVTKEILNIKFPDDSYPYLDIEIWKQINKKEVINEPKFYHLGLKHGIGKTGGGGHPLNWPNYNENDSNDNFIKSIIDNESFLFYQSLKINSMKKYHINYADIKYFESQKKCSQSAKDFGFDEVISYSINDLDSDFLEKNKEILKLPRGAGYWVWKSYIIKKTLDKLNYGDLLVYSDSGSIYQSSIQPLIDTIINDTHGVLSFELTGLIEKSYTKMDCFNLMGLNNPKYTDTSQRESTYIWLIKNDFTIKLISEFVEYSQNKHIITDLPNITGNNFTTFKDHRHDQSIWSLLCKKYDITPHRLISQYGNKLVNYFPNDTWGQITLHHRNPI